MSRRSDSVLTKKKAIIGKGEVVHWGFGLIIVKDRGRLQTADTVGTARQPRMVIITHTGGNKCH